MSCIKSQFFKSCNCIHILLVTRHYISRLCASRLTCQFPLLHVFFFLFTFVIIAQCRKTGFYSLSCLRCSFFKCAQFAIISFDIWNWKVWRSWSPRCRLIKKFSNDHDHIISSSLSLEKNVCAHGRGEQATNFSTIDEARESNPGG